MLMDWSQLDKLIEIAGRHGLTELDLSCERLTSLPTELGNLTNLSTLNLARNLLTSVPAELGNLTNLRMLDLSGNELTSVPAELGRLTGLETLNLADNQIQSLPKEFLNLSIELEDEAGYWGRGSVLVGDNPLVPFPASEFRDILSRHNSCLGKDLRL